MYEVLGVLERRGDDPGSSKEGLDREGEIEADDSMAMQEED